jgi:hypothetical protein
MTDSPQTRRARFALEFTPGQQSTLEILAISAGIGNGWSFSAQVLERSLPMWNGVESFIDHAVALPSVRDLAGICSDARWDELNKGVRLTLNPCGPAAKVLTDLAQEICEMKTPRPKVGFSADLLFSASGDTVTQIEKVFSVDLVTYPARGGSFLHVQPASIQNQKKETQTMPEVMLQIPTSSAELPLPQTQQSGIDTESATAQKLCTSLLETTLASAQLPPALETSLREHFSGVFTPGSLDTAISEARQLVSDLTDRKVVQSAGCISEIVSSGEQISAALHDLLGAGRPAGLEKVHPARLSGIREFYTLMTGDHDFVGGYDQRRAKFATADDLPGVLKNAMNKLILNQWEELGRSGYRWWEPVVQVEHFNSLQEITGVLVGEVTVLPAVSEGAAYTELAVSDSSETGAWGKYGGYVGLTLEMFERDETHKLRQYPRKLASAALRRISSLVGAVFTANGGIGPVMADTYNVFEAGHHANLGTTALASASFEAAGKALYNQPLAVASGGTAAKQALDAKYLLVPRDLRLTAMNLLYPSFAHESNIFSENMQRGQMGDVITCPEFTDANDWAAIADPRLAPGIILGERFGVLPEIIIADGETNGALFTNDEIRMKVRHWVSVFVADYRPLYKANVA